MTAKAELERTVMDRLGGLSSAKCIGLELELGKGLGTLTLMLTVVMSQVCAQDAGLYSAVYRQCAHNSICTSALLIVLRMS